MASDQPLRPSLTVPVTTVWVCVCH